MLYLLSLQLTLQLSKKKLPPTQSSQSKEPMPKVSLLMLLQVLTHLPLLETKSLMRLPLITMTVKTLKIRQSVRKLTRLWTGLQAREKSLLARHLITTDPLPSRISNADRLVNDLIFMTTVSSSQWTLASSLLVSKTNRINQVLSVFSAASLEVLSVGSQAEATSSSSNLFSRLDTISLDSRSFCSSSHSRSTVNPSRSTASHSRYMVSHSRYMVSYSRYMVNLSSSSSSSPLDS